jgi:hypothetical protein
MLLLPGLLVRLQSSPHIDLACSCNMASALLVLTAPVNTHYLKQRSN